MTTETWIIAALSVVMLGLWIRGIIARLRDAHVKATWELHAPLTSTEFKTLEEMTAEELEFERTQKWSILKSDTAWWICRNEVPFMHCPGGLQAANEVLKKYNLACIDVDTRQGPTTNQAWREFRRTRELVGDKN